MNVSAYRRTARIAGRYQYFSRKAAVGGRRVRRWSFRYAALTSIGRVRADIMCTAPGEQHCSDDGSSSDHAPTRFPAAVRSGTRRFVRGALVTSQYHVTAADSAAVASRPSYNVDYGVVPSRDRM